MDQCLTAGDRRGGSDGKRSGQGFFPYNNQVGASHPEVIDEDATPLKMGDVHYPQLDPEIQSQSAQGNANASVDHAEKSGR